MVDVACAQGTYGHITDPTQTGCVHGGSVISKGRQISGNSAEVVFHVLRGPSGDFTCLLKNILCVSRKRTKGRDIEALGAGTVMVWARVELPGR